MSRYDVLAKRSAPASAATSGAGKASGARRGNPGYRQFSAYIPAELYRKVKVQLAERDLDLSEAVEHALTEWVRREGTINSALRVNSGQKRKGIDANR
jgi:hypothetical protein